MDVTARLGAWGLLRWGLGVYISVRNNFCDFVEISVKCNSTAVKPTKEVSNEADERFNGVRNM